MVILSEDLKDGFINRLRKHEDINFTYFSPVYGKGSSGIRFGKDFAPGENTLFLIDSSDNNEIAVIKAIIQDIKAKKKPKQGLHAIFIE